MLSQGSYEVVTPVDSAERVSVDQICEENIQLFMRYIFNLIIIFDIAASFCLNSCLIMDNSMLKCEDLPIGLKIFLTIILQKKFLAVMLSILNILCVCCTDALDKKKPLLNMVFYLV